MIIYFEPQERCTEEERELINDRVCAGLNRLMGSCRHMLGA